MLVDVSLWLSFCFGATNASKSSNAFLTVSLSESLETWRMARTHTWASRNSPYFKSKRKLNWIFHLLNRNNDEKIMSTFLVRALVTVIYCVYFSPFHVLFFNLSKATFVENFIIKLKFTNERNRKSQQPYFTFLIRDIWLVRITRTQKKTRKNYSNFIIFFFSLLTSHFIVSHSFALFCFCCFSGSVRPPAIEWIQKWNRISLSIISWIIALFNKP